MKFLPHKTITTILLTILLWSCFGLGLGMLGHTMTNMDMVHAGESHDRNTPYECCTKDASTQSSDDMMMSEHHTMQIAIRATVNFFVVAVAFFLFVFAVSRVRTPFAHIRYYLKRWEEQWLYFADMFRRLFSAGILHPQIW